MIRYNNSTQLDEKKIVVMAPNMLSKVQKKKKILVYISMGRIVYIRRVVENKMIGKILIFSFLWYIGGWFILCG